LIGYVTVSIGVNPLVSTVSGDPRKKGEERKGRGWREGKGKGKGREGRGHSLIFTWIDPLTVTQSITELGQ